MKRGRIAIDKVERTASINITQVIIVRAQQSELLLVQVFFWKTSDGRVWINRVPCESCLRLTHL